MYIFGAASVPVKLDESLIDGGIRRPKNVTCEGKFQISGSASCRWSDLYQQQQQQQHESNGSCMWDSRRFVPHSCWPKTWRLGPITAAVYEAQVAQRQLEPHLVKGWLPEPPSAAGSSVLNPVSWLLLFDAFTRNCDHTNIFRYFKGIFAAHVPLCAPQVVQLECARPPPPHRCSVAFLVYSRWEETQMCSRFVYTRGLIY